MKSKKENILYDYIKMIQNSWTYKKMTLKEKNNIINILKDERILKAIKGKKEARWNILQAIYFTYLQAIEYDGYNWREDSTDEKTKF